MWDERHKIWNHVTLLVFGIWRIYFLKVHILLKCLKLVFRTQVTAKMYSWTYLFKNNQVRRFVKCIISSTSRTHVRDLPRPAHLDYGDFIYDQAYNTSSLHGKLESIQYNVAAAITGAIRRTSAILVTSRNGVRKIMQSVRITSRPLSRLIKWNQLSQFRWTSTKLISIKKT